MREHGIIHDVTWGEAFDRISGTLLQIKKEYGSESLGFLASAKVSNEENYLFMKMARAVFKSNNIDHCARL
jgi:predicted molibdopterin-dependent oxidoreductase YjgC